MAIDTSNSIAGVTGTITFGDGETVEVEFLTDGTIKRWGAADPILGRAVDATEGIRDTLRERFGFGPVPEAGERRRYDVTVFDDDGAGPTMLELEATLSTDIDDSNILFPLVPYTTASAFLEAWAAKSPRTRVYHCGETDNADIVVSWIHDGKIILDVWHYTESNVGVDGFSLDVLVDGTLLTNTHYSIQEKTA